MQFRGPIYKSLPNGASEWRYSARNCPSARLGHSKRAIHPERVGRGPPTRLGRPELQALSNSLQLTSI